MSHLRAVRIRNFKAIRDSGLIKLMPLTVFIGNNGSGKSSLIEALQLFQSVVTEGVDTALGLFGGIQHVRHKEARSRSGQALGSDSLQIDPLQIHFRAQVPEVGMTRSRLELNMRPDETPYIQTESYAIAGVDSIRDRQANKLFGDGRSMLSLLNETRPLYSAVDSWQFMSLAPDLMGVARQQQRVRGRVRLNRDGSNLAGYVMDLASRAPEAFNGVVDAMRFILPYAQDVRPVIPKSDIDRRVYLELKERNFTVPGWLFSSGTLRMLAILCLLRDPSPPPVVFIEELENGLDPRTIGLLISEIRAAVENRQIQVIATTHSPYLLDQLLFKHVVVVERNNGGAPEFWRPEDDEKLRKWNHDFSLGQIYTMGRLFRDRDTLPQKGE